MRKLNLSLVFGFILLLSSCRTVDIVTEVDPTIDFTTFDNYMMMQRLESEMLTDKTKKLIGSAIAKEMDKRGYNQTLSPDLIVKVMVISREKEAAMVTRHNDFYWGSSTYNYGWGIGTGINKVSYNTYKEGTLVIDIIDKENKLLVWQGIATGAFKGSDKRKEKDLNNMIAKVFRTMPNSKK